MIASQSSPYELNKYSELYCHHSQSIPLFDIESMSSMLVWRVGTYLKPPPWDQTYTLPCISKPYFGWIYFFILNYIFHSVSPLLGGKKWKSHTQDQ